MSPERIERIILLVRGHRVMVDTDLAALYGVDTKTLNRAVKRNRERFPADFMFQLTPEETDDLRCQIGTSSLEPAAGPSARWGGRRYPPYVFTEQGVAMLSSVLRSRRAVLVNVEVMRTFVRLREMLASHKDLARREPSPTEHAQNGMSSSSAAAGAPAGASSAGAAPRAVSAPRPPPPRNCTRCAMISVM